MSLTQCQIHLRKDAFKFSAAHMTVFPDGSKESLHGHNYQVEVTLALKDASLQKMLPFSDYKKIILALCNEWDEKVLLASECPFFKLVNDSTQGVEFTLCGKRYVLPKDEVVLLSTENTTSESLSEIFCFRFLKQFSFSNPELPFNKTEIKITETAGQGASFIWCEV